MDRRKAVVAVCFGLVVIFFATHDFHQRGSPMPLFQAAPEISEIEHVDNSSSLRAIYGEPDHFDARQCFVAEPVFIFPPPLNQEEKKVLSVCDGWMDDSVSYRSSVKCSREDLSSPFAVYCKLSNVCYSNYTFFVFQDQNIPCASIALIDNSLRPPLFPNFHRPTRD